MKLEAQDIEKLSDSNSDIKGRLSEVVRENAKEMLDPERKVNGQPVPVHQPKLFTGGVMRWYQVEGIEWLRVSRQQGRGKKIKQNGNCHKAIQVKKKKIKFRMCADIYHYV